MVTTAACVAAPPPLHGRRIAFTSPPIYGARLARLLELRGAEPLPVPTILVEPTPATISALRRHLDGGAASLETFSAVAFTSRVGISAFAAAFSGTSEPPPAKPEQPLTVCALGKDAELLYENGLLSQLRRNGRQVRVLVPEVASTEGLVAALGEGRQRRILCPVPAVVGLVEPPVVPDFLRGLAAQGWAPERVSAYETKWAGQGCAAALIAAAPPPDALVFTSTAEVEGLVKALDAAGWQWRAARERWRETVVAAHGPVTARGAAALGVKVDVVGSSFGSFDGVLDAIATALTAGHEQPALVHGEEVPHRQTRSISSAGVCIRRGGGGCITLRTESTAMEEKGTVCVTGAAGFLASWLIKKLLLAGYRVRGTVRDPEDGEKVAHLWELEGAPERLQLMKADLMEEGSFDEAVRGCEGVFHTASPVVVVKSDPKAEILDPAIKGTLNVLRSCKKNPSLRRVVLTSSSSAVRVRPQEEFNPAVPLDDSSWSSVELCERLQIWYPLAKVLSEKAAWKFAEENELDMVTVLPSFIVGPSLPRRRCKTVSDVVGLLQGNADGFAWYGRMGYVHIDDVARCHVLVYESAAARGRYICSAAVLSNGELAGRLAERYPWLPVPRRFENPLGVESPLYELDSSKLRSMGFGFRGIEEMFDDVVESVEELRRRRNSPALQKFV